MQKNMQTLIPICKILQGLYFAYSAYICTAARASLLMMIMIPISSSHDEISRSFRRHHRHLTTAHDRLARARPGSIRDDRVRPATVGRAGPFRFRGPIRVFAIIVGFASAMTQHDDNVCFLPRWYCIFSETLIRYI